MLDNLQLKGPSKLQDEFLQRDGFLWILKNEFLQKNSYKEMNS